jgi:hypothetical protein
MHKSLEKKVRKRILTLNRQEERRLILSKNLKAKRNESIKRIGILIILLPVYYPFIARYGYNRFLDINYECPPVAYLFGLIIVQGLYYVLVTELINRTLKL